MSTHPPLLMDVAKRCLELYREASTENADLWGCSLLDLMADNIPNVSLFDLKCAIIAGGIYPIANERIKKQIASYK